VSGALEGVVVLEIGHGIAGPFASRLLGDLGADVIKLEAADGDFVRRRGPFADDAGGNRTSALFELLNWNKRSVALDLHEEPARERARVLAREADIVIVSLSPRRLEAWGLDGASLRAGAERLVVTSVSNFGADGPLRDWLGSDLVFQAMGGVAQISGVADREPLKRGLRQSLWCAGINAAYASLAGYLAAQRTGSGAHIDLAIRECPASELVLNEAFYACMGAVQGRRPLARDPLGGPLGGGDPLPTANGYVALQVTPQVPVERLAKLLGEPRLAEARFATSAGRAAHAAELGEILAERLDREDGLAFFERASEEGLLCGLVRGAAELLACPQLRARDALRTIPGLDGLEFPAVLANLSQTPVAIRTRAPSLGQHTAEVLTAPPRQPRAGLPARGIHPAEGPLAGLRVVDLSYVFAAPYVGALLADLGAEVIKVEAPHRLDQSRTIFSPFFENDPESNHWDRAGAFHVVNRGKRSLSLNLAVPEGRDLLRGLVTQADVLLENFTPRVMRGWGMTYPELAELNPRLVMLSNTGFGSSGPWSAFRAQGTTLEATMGLSRYAGYEDGPPSKVGQSYPDFLACWTAMLMVLASLVHRERSGQGQWIDLGMHQLGAAVIPEALLRFQLTGEDERRGASHEPDALFAGVVAAAGDDRWLAVTALSESQLEALRETVGASAGEAPEHALATWASSRDVADAAARLQAAGVPAGPVLDARDLFEDRQLRARGFYEDVVCPDGRVRPLIGRPYRWRSERSSVGVRGCGPDFGEAATWVLEDILGLGPQGAQALRQAGVVTDAPVAPASVDALDLEAMLRSGSLVRVDGDYRDVLTAATEGTGARATAGVASGIEDHGGAIRASFGDQR
jgi:crotonobetainyl-CoA:carnitine CoA-transferase CaiB-like acyl-CoA transferase